MAGSLVFMVYYCPRCIIDIQLESCAILTTSANATVVPIHERMPVILSPDAFLPWLDPSFHDAERLATLLAPCPPGQVEAYPVSTLVNSPANDTQRASSQCPPSHLLDLPRDNL